MPSKEFTRQQYKIMIGTVLLATLITSGITGHLQNWDFDHVSENGSHLAVDMFVFSLLFSISSLLVVLSLNKNSLESVYSRS